MANTVVTHPSVGSEAPASPSTTTLAGAAIVLSAGLTSLTQFGSFLPRDLGRLLLTTAEPAILLSAVLLMFATGVLAFGWRGERGLVGSSVVGKVALLTFGALPLLSAIVSWWWWNVLPPTADDLWTLLINTSAPMTVLTLAAGIVSGLAIVRARVVHGFARWALLVVAVWELAFYAARTLPSVLLEPKERDLLVESWNAGGIIWVVAAGTVLRVLWGGSYILARVRASSR